MRRNDNYILRDIAGEYILVPTGAATAQLSGIVSFSETSAFVWEQLAQEQTVTQLVQAVTDAYDVTEELATQEVTQLLQQLAQMNLLQEENNRV